MTKEPVRAPTVLKRFLPAALLAAGLAAPLATAGAAEARDGCGLGFHRGLYGFCRPNLRPRVFYRPYAFRPAFYRPRRFGWGGPRWHRWGGYRHVGWGHRGWGHRGWGHRGWGHHGWHHRW